MYYLDSFSITIIEINFLYIIFKKGRALSLLLLQLLFELEKFECIAIEDCVWQSRAELSEPDMQARLEVHREVF